MQRFISVVCQKPMKYFILFVACVLISCQKTIPGESTDPGENNNDVKTKVIWTGPVETDGCGWTLLIDNTYYHPETLSEEFQQDQLNVIVSYQLTKGLFICGFAANRLLIINITSMRRE
jgi:hypothetical protein